MFGIFWRACLKLIKYFIWKAKENIETTARKIKLEKMTNRRNSRVQSAPQAPHIYYGCWTSFLYNNFWNEYLHNIYIKLSDMIKWDTTTAQPSVCQLLSITPARCDDCIRPTSHIHIALFLNLFSIFSQRTEIRTNVSEQHVQPNTIFQFCCFKLNFFFKRKCDILALLTSASLTTEQ